MPIIKVMYAGVREELWSEMVSEIPKRREIIQNPKTRKPFKVVSVINKNYGGGKGITNVYVE